MSNVLFRKRKVLVAVPTLGGSVNASIARLFWELGVMNTDPRHPFSYDTFIAEGYFPHDRARNIIIRAGLETDMEFLWTIDADMRIPPNWQLLFTHYNCKAISGLAFGWQASGMGVREPKPTPVIFKRTEDGGYVNEELQTQPFEADAAGAACLVLRRDLIEKVGFPWFRFEYEEDGSIKTGEDVYFFRKANALGERVFIDTRVMVGHWKEQDTLDTALYGINVRRSTLLKAREERECRNAAG